MPRLTDEQIKQGLFHDNIEVRTEALQYFRHVGGPPNPTVMPLVIEALNRFGKDKAFQFNHLFTSLAQTPETIRWAVAELGAIKDVPVNEPGFGDDLGALLADADPELVRPHAEAIKGFPAIRPRHLTALTRRLDFWTRDESWLWAQLDVLSRRMAKDAYGADEDNEEEDSSGLEDSSADDYSRGQGTLLDLTEALSRFGASVVPRMTKLLQQDLSTFPKNEEWRYWMESAAVRLAGFLRHEPSVPVIVEKFKRDEEVLNEDCQFALARIGTDEVARQIRSAYSPDSEWGLRLFMGGVLGKIPSEAAVNTLMELINLEDDGELRDSFIVDLCGLFSPEGIEFCYKQLDSGDYDPNATERLLTVCELTGQTFPRLAEWKKEIEETKRLREEERRKYEELWKKNAQSNKAEIRRDQMAATPVRPPVVGQSFQPIVKQQTVGRNDPCPCGSGKKYKKCCALKNG